MARSEETPGSPGPALLVARYPRLDVSPVPLVRMTPVVAAPWAGPAVWVKRDDQLGEGLPGGSKLRKLAYLLAQHPGGPLVAFGPTGSNWLVAAVAVGQSLGWPVSAFAFRSHAYPGAADKMAWLAGRADRSTGPSALAVTLARALAAAARGARLLPPGGSSALGALGLVAAAFELAEQVRRGELPAPHTVYVPYGSGGTAVGLAIGLELAELPSTVRAVRVNERAVANPLAALALARGVLARLGLAPGRAPGLLSRRLRWEHGQFGGRYGRPTPSGRAALRRAAAAGLVLDPAYSAKTTAALLADRAAGRTEPALLWLTYGGIGASHG